MLLLRLRPPHEKKHTESPQIRSGFANVYAMKISETLIFKTRRLGVDSWKSKIKFT